MGILSAISAAMALLDHLWGSWNNSGMVQAKVAQMTQDQKDAHAATVNQAMHGATLADRQAALTQLRNLTSE